MSSIRVGLKSTSSKLNAGPAALTPRAKANLAASLIKAHFTANSAKFPNTDNYDTGAVQRIKWGIGEAGIRAKKGTDGSYRVVVPFYDSNGNWSERRISIALDDVLRGKRGLPPPSAELKAALKGVQLSFLRVGD